MKLGTYFNVWRGEVETTPCSKNNKIEKIFGNIRENRAYVLSPEIETGPLLTIASQTYDFHNQTNYVYYCLFSKISCSIS